MDNPLHWSFERGHAQDPQCLLHPECGVHCRPHVQYFDPLIPIRWHVHSKSDAYTLLSILVQQSCCFHFQNICFNRTWCLISLIIFMVSFCHVRTCGFVTHNTTSLFADENIFSTSVNNNRRQKKSSSPSFSTMAMWDTYIKPTDEMWILSVGSSGVHIRIRIGDLHLRSINPQELRMQLHTGLCMYQEVQLILVIRSRSSNQNNQAPARHW